MRFRITAIILAFLMLFAAGCSKEVEVDEHKSVSYTEKFIILSETDIQATYSLPYIRNMKNEEFQSDVNYKIMLHSSDELIKSRKNEAEKLISVSDLSEYDFSEYGTYKIHFNDGDILSLSISVEQRFSKDDDSHFSKVNYSYNFDLNKGELFDIGNLFEDPSQTEDYLAKKLYERLDAMDCLETDSYSDAVFKSDLLSHCVIAGPNKIAVITTSGRFGLKVSAGAPIVEISIPEDYYKKSK